MTTKNNTTPSNTLSPQPSDPSLQSLVLSTCSPKSQVLSTQSCQLSPKSSAPSPISSSPKSSALSPCSCSPKSSAPSPISRSPQSQVLSPKSYLLSPQSRIYIAGHRGMVGSAILRKLTADGYTNIITRTHKELDLTEQQAVRDFFRKEKIDYVVLAAAKVGGIHANNTYPADFITINLQIQTNVISEAYKAGIDKLLFLGSSCIYPKFAPQPMKEEYLLTGELEPTNEPYAIAKIAGIKMCEAYNRQYGTSYRSVMPTNLYGPGDNYHLENSHVIPAMIRKFHLAKLAMQGNLAAIQKAEALYGPIPQDIKQAICLKPDSSNFLDGYTPLCTCSSQSQAPSPCSSSPQSQDLSPKSCLSSPKHSALSPSSSSPQSSVLSPSSLSPKVVLWGTGQARREFLHVDDMAAACVFVMGLDQSVFSHNPNTQSSTQSPSSSSPKSQVLSPESCQLSPESSVLSPSSNSPKSSALSPGSSPSFVNVGTGQDQTIAETAELVRQAVGYEGEVVFDATKPDGTPRKLLDVSRLQQLGWESKLTLREGIEKTYQSATI